MCIHALIKWSLTTHCLHFVASTTAKIGSRWIPVLIPVLIFSNTEILVLGNRAGIAGPSNNPKQVIHTKQHNLVLAKGHWCSVAGEVTAGLAENNGSLPPGGWHAVTCRLTACTLGSAPGPTLGIEYGKTFTFTFTSKGRHHFLCRDPTKWQVIF